MIFPRASSFIIPITFLGKLLVSNLASRSLLILHTSAEVFTCNLMGKTVSLCEEKFYTISLLLLDLVIVEVIHQSHADIEDAHSTAHSQLTDLLNASLVRFMWIATRSSSIIMQCLNFAFALSYDAFFRLLTSLTSTRLLIFFHSFSRDRVVHLEEIFIEFTCCFRAQLSVGLNVISHPRIFNETDSFTNLFDPQVRAG